MHYPTAKANDRVLRDRRKELRNNATPAENALWKALRGRNVGGLKFRRQQGMGAYILDFYCPELKLCIELDGSSHNYKYQYDEQRTQFLREQGIRVVRYANEQVWTSVSIIAKDILRVADEIRASMQQYDEGESQTTTPRAIGREVTDPTQGPSKGKSQTTTPRAIGREGTDPTPDPSP